MVCLPARLNERDETLGEDIQGIMIRGKIPSTWIYTLKKLYPYFNPRLLKLKILRIPSSSYLSILVPHGTVHRIGLFKSLKNNSHEK